MRNAAGGRSQPRVLILHQGCVPALRQRFFELLSERGRCAYAVVHGSPPPHGVTAASGPFGFSVVEVRNRHLRLFGRTLIYQPVLRHGLAGRYDAIVIGHELKYASSMILMALFFLRRKPVVFWGFGDHREASEDLGGDESLLFAFLDRAKRFLAIRSDGYLAYTQKGADYLRALGLPDHRVRVLRNTIDMAGQIRLHQECASSDVRSLRQAFGLRPDSVVLAFLGRLRREKGVDVLIDAVRQLNAEAADSAPVELLVIGDGEERATLERRAGGDGHVRFLGNLDMTDRRIGQCLRIAAAVVIPGYVGLAVNHAFAHGVPLITRQSKVHSPEIEYIEPGVNGLVVDGDVPAFVDALRAFVAFPEAQARLAEGALRTRDLLSLDHMVEQFDQGVMAFIEAGRA